jgi:hypothetical protein
MNLPRPQPSIARGGSTFNSHPSSFFGISAGCCTVPFFTSLERALDDFLTSGVMTIITVAVGENVPTILGWGHQAHCKFSIASHHFGPASLRENGMTFQVTGWNRVTLLVFWF